MAQLDRTTRFVILDKHFIYFSKETMMLKRNDVLKFLAGAAVAGMLTGSVARAEGDAHPKEGEGSGDHGCSGKAGCSAETKPAAATKDAKKAKGAHATKPAAAPHGEATPAPHGAAPAKKTK